MIVLPVQSNICFKQSFPEAACLPNGMMIVRCEQFKLGVFFLLLCKATGAHSLEPPLCCLFCLPTRHDFKDTQLAIIHHAIPDILLLFFGLIRV